MERVNGKSKMRRSGQNCECGMSVPYMVCSHCKPQVSRCPGCGEKVLLRYTDPIDAGKEIVRRFKENAGI